MPQLQPNTNVPLDMGYQSITISANGGGTAVFRLDTYTHNGNPVIGKASGTVAAGTQQTINFNVHDDHRIWNTGQVAFDYMVQ